MCTRGSGTEIFPNATPLAYWYRLTSYANRVWQVCAYRCITSYETKTMENFSLCVLQKNNCMGNSAQIPVLPDPTPLARFRGEAVTQESAQDIFMGWLGKEAFSWKVVSMP